MSEREVINNQKHILKNQKTILSNQSQIKANQGTITKNQASILKNQNSLNTIIKNQEQILALLKKSGYIEHIGKSAYGLTEAAYMSRNLLGREVTAEDVAQAFLDLALARSTTGSFLTVDGGNVAAAPR